jgi:hypothetical protein
MIRPWFRSRFFWFGIPVLLLLSFGWLAFPLGGAGLGWSSGEHMLSVEDSSGVVKVRWSQGHDGMAMPSGWTARWLSRGDGIEEAHTKRFPPAIGWTGWEGGTLFRSASFQVSYWCLIVIYLAFWIEALIRWQRNKGRRQLLKPYMEPPPR